MSNIHNLAILANQLDENFFPEIECHELYQDEFVKHKVEDENDLGFVCRNHEVYLEDGPDIHGTAEIICDRVTDSVWTNSFWNFHDNMERSYKFLNIPYSDLFESSWKYADKRVNQLENY